MAPGIHTSMQEERLYGFLRCLLGRETGPFEMTGGQGIPRRRKVGLCLPKPIEVPIAHSSMIFPLSEPVKARPAFGKRRASGKDPAARVSDLALRPPSKYIEQAGYATG